MLQINQNLKRFKTGSVCCNAGIHNAYRPEASSSLSSEFAGTVV